MAIIERPSMSIFWSARTSQQSGFRFFERHGYEIFQQTHNFIRLRLANDPAGALPVDLMLADQQTFNNILAESTRRQIAEGIRLAIASPLHLVTMKLHALRNPKRLEQGLDFQDVIYLIKSAKIDIHGKDFNEIAERYATAEHERRLSGNLKTNQACEDHRTADLPRFDSIPAAAGLTVAEAFRLSIQHALALLPTLSKEPSFRERPGNPERFYLR